VPGKLPREVKGIAVNRKADALFFLQAARIDRRRSAQEVQQGKQYELAHYVVHYADGKTATVPVRSEMDVEDYKQKNPEAVPGAQLAWTAPYRKTGFSAAAYSMQWTNPRPDVEIRRIDFVHGKDGRGVPVLLAVTAATAGK
jgi:beta-galactosidase